MAATLDNLLTGHVPRDFPKDQDPWLAVLENPPVPIRQRNPRVPAKLAEVIDHALVEEPEIPFKSAEDFKQALERALESQFQPSPLTRLWAPQRFSWHFAGGEPAVRTRPDQCPRPFPARRGCPGPGSDGGTPTG